MHALFQFKKEPDAQEIDASGATVAELNRHHAYDEAAAASAFIAPIVLPYQRLLTLKGEDTLLEMSDKARISTRELSLLMNTEYLEPTTSQLLSLSLRYNVSIMWLLGYHTKKESHYGGGDRELLIAVAHRNAIEKNMRSLPESGFFADFFRRHMQSRVHAANLNIGTIAARIIARERLPLDNEELSLMLGQPVFTERNGIEDGEWGIVEDDCVHTRTENLYFDENGERFRVYMTPKTKGEMV